MVHEKPKLLLTVKERKLKYIGHLIRGNGEQETLKGLEGKEDRGIHGVEIF